MSRAAAVGRLLFCPHLHVHCFSFDVAADGLVRVRRSLRPCNHGHRS